MIQIEVDSQFEAPNDAVQLSEMELSRMVFTDADLQAIGLTEPELAAMALTIEEIKAMTDADWARLRLSQQGITLLREDLMLRFGVSAQSLPWLCRAIERGQHGHKRAQTGTY